VKTSSPSLAELFDRRRLSLLAPESLQTLSSFSFGRPLARGVLGVAAFPLAWTGGGGGEADGSELTLSEAPEAENGSAILVADREGFVYLLDPPGEQP